MNAADCCDLLSEFLTLHQQQQRLVSDILKHRGCDLLSEFLTLHQQQQQNEIKDIKRAVVICFQNF